MKTLDMLFDIIINCWFIALVVYSLFVILDKIFLHKMDYKNITMLFSLLIGLVFSLGCYYEKEESTDKLMEYYSLTNEEYDILKTNEKEILKDNMLREQLKNILERSKLRETNDCYFRTY